MITAARSSPRGPTRALTIAALVYRECSPWQLTVYTAQSAMRFHTFLSHNWGTDESGRDNHARVIKVGQRLKEAGFNPWIDEEYMRGDVNKTMTDALRVSSSVIVFITKSYVEKASGNGPRGGNDNCKYELDTALLELGVNKIIPVVMESVARSARLAPWNRKSKPRRQAVYRSGGG